MNPGIYYNLSNEEYHFGPGISKSGLDRIARSPAHYRYGEPAQSAEFAFGTAFHELLLTPDIFQYNYTLAYQPGADDLVTCDDIKAELKKHGAPVSGKKEELISRILEIDPDARIADRIREQHESGRIVLSAADYDALHRMYEAVMAYPVARELLDEITDVEPSGYWHDPETGVLCRCRPDAVLSSRLLDLKTTRDASAAGFAMSCKKYRYDIQAIHYSYGWAKSGGFEPDDFVFLAVEKTPPYAPAVYNLDADTLGRAYDVWRDDINTYARCLERDEWPGYGPGIETLSFRRHQWT